MINIGNDINNLILKRLTAINTIDIGRICEINRDKNTCRVRLQRKINAVVVPLNPDNEAKVVDLVDVPIMKLHTGMIDVYADYQRGDYVVVGYTKYNRTPQLLNEIPVNFGIKSQSSFDNAIILGGIVQWGMSIDKPENPQDVWIKHKCGSCIVMKGDGEIDINGAAGSSIQFLPNGDITINGANIIFNKIEPVTPTPVE